MLLFPDDPGYRLRLLYEATSLHTGSLDTRLDAALELVTEALGLEVARSCSSARPSKRKR